MTGGWTTSGMNVPYCRGVETAFRQDDVAHRTGSDTSCFAFCPTVSNVDELRYWSARILAPWRRGTRRLSPFVSLYHQWGASSSAFCYCRLPASRQLRPPHALAVRNAAFLAPWCWCSSTGRDWTWAFVSSSWCVWILLGTRMFSIIFRCIRKCETNVKVKLKTSYLRRCCDYFSSTASGSVDELIPSMLTLLSQDNNQDSFYILLPVKSTLF